MPIAQANFSWIPFIAAFGSIAASIMGLWGIKAVALFNQRHNWIRDFWNDVLNFLEKVQVLQHLIAIFGSSKVTELHTKAVLDAWASAKIAHRQLRLRLVMGEPVSVKLAEQMDSLMENIFQAADTSELDAIERCAHAVLKYKWQMAKIWYIDRSRPVGLRLTR